MNLNRELALVVAGIVAAGAAIGAAIGIGAAHAYDLIVHRHRSVR